MIQFQRREIEDEKLLFGRDNDLEKLNYYIDQKVPAIVVTGLRRVGKSSLIRCAVKNRNHIVINAWEMGTKIPSREDILQIFRQKIETFLNENKTRREQIKEFIYSISEFHIDTPQLGGGISFKERVVPESTLSSILDSINKWANKHNELFVLVLDEVQDFAHAIDIDLRKILASFYYPDHRNAVLILTGSEIGTLHDFVSISNSDGPLFGRPREIVHVSPFSDTESENFLLTGLSDGGVPIIRTIPANPLIKQVITEVGGIVGWIIIFGLRCIDKKTISLEVLNETRDEASEIVKKEFNKFLEIYKNQETYQLIVNNLAILNAYNFDKFLKEQMLEKYLKQLINSGFVHKIEGEEIYEFIDPLVGYHFRKTAALNNI